MVKEPKINIVKYENSDSDAELFHSRKAISCQVVIGFPDNCGLCVGEARAGLYNKAYLLEMTQDTVYTHQSGENRRFSIIGPGVVNSREEARKVLLWNIRRYAKEMSQWTGLGVNDLTRQKEGALTEKTGVEDVMSDPFGRPNG